jgi:predicted TIM-barrel fold metal-dependent hydrolase
MPHILADLPVLDCHIHFGHPDFMPSLFEILDQTQVGKFNIVCTPHRTRLSLVPDALLAKSFQPQRIYVFGGLDISPYFMKPDSCGAMFAEYVETLSKMGCDGIKMVEGKPEWRKMLPIPPFDSPVFEPYWQKLEESGIPLVWHVNDPEEFWDAQRVPEWARAQGWFYGDGTFINNEAQYTEVLHVLERHPQLKVIFAHFFFLSTQLLRLADILEHFPNLCVDLTPGIEMYQTFTRAIQTTREFFLNYQDRILFGTDIGAKALVATPEMGIEFGESAIRIKLVRNFLETDGEFHLDSAGGSLLGNFGDTYQGLGLPKEVLRKIYCQNFERLSGIQPKTLDPQTIVAECERLVTMIPLIADIQSRNPGDITIAKMVKEHFLNQN